MFEKFSNIQHGISNGLSLDNYNSIRDDLKAKNWKKEDIDNYIDFITGVNFYKTSVIKNISEIITNRCLNLFINYTVGGIGSSILKHITYDVIDFKLSNLSEAINDIKNQDQLYKNQINDLQEQFEKSCLTDISRLYYAPPPPRLYEDFKDSVVFYIKLINPSEHTIKTIMEEETNANDGDRAIKKSKNHTDLGKIFFTELGKKGPPYSTIASLFLSNIATDYNAKPDSTFIKSVYNSISK